MRKGSFVIMEIRIIDQIVPGLDHLERGFSRWRPERLIELRKVIGRRAGCSAAWRFSRTRSGWPAFGIANTPCCLKIHASAICAGVAVNRSATAFSVLFFNSASLFERRVRHHGNAARAAPRKQVVFDAAAHEVVQDLIGRDQRARGQLERDELFHVGNIKIADTPVPDLPVAFQRVECLERFGQRRAASPMEQIQVKSIGPQPAKTRFAGGDRASPAGILRHDLAHQKDFAAATRRALRPRVPRPRRRHTSRRCR